MGVPYNFLQELSGAGRSIAPSEFDDSSRYIGTIQQDNFFFGNESGVLYATLNLYEKGNVSNERFLNSFTLDALSNTKIPNETGFVRLSLQNPNLSRIPLETGSVSLSASGRSSLFPLETGSIHVSLSSNFISGINDPYDLNINFNYGFSGVIKDDFSNTLSLELFIKSILRDNPSLAFVLSTGEYKGGASMNQIDYGNLNLVIFTGSYSGPE
jgi:hypothetical protein